MEIFPFGRRELTTAIHTSTQIFNHSVITIKPGHCLTVYNKMRIAIFVLSCNRNKNNTLEIESALIPTSPFLIEPCQCWSHVIISLTRMQV